MHARRPLISTLEREEALVAATDALLAEGDLDWWVRLDTVDREAAEREGVREALLAVGRSLRCCPPPPVAEYWISPPQPSGSPTSEAAMSGINWTRVWLGGLAAAAMLLTFTLVVVAFFGEATLETYERLGHPFAPTWAFSLVALALHGVAGVVATWLYAAIRPRYRSGGGTAVRVGTVLWLFASINLFWALWLLVPVPLVTAILVTLLPAYIAATAAGAWLYQEEEEEEEEEEKEEEIVSTARADGAT